jgi:FkbM family methyltransferase
MDLRISVYDVGARYGLHPSLELLLGKAQVHLFEPDPVEATRLSQQYEAMPALTVHQTAVGEASVSRVFELRRHRGLSGFADQLANTTEWQIGVYQEGLARDSIIEVPVQPLSDFLGEDPAILKVDCEGGEFQVIQSCGSALERVVGLRIETSFKPLYHGAATFSDIESFLADNQLDFIGFDTAPNGFDYGRFSLPHSIVRRVAGDALWVKRRRDFRDSRDWLAASLFLYLQHAHGLGLELLDDWTDEGVQLDFQQSAIESLIHALVIKHVLEARTLQYYAVEDIEATYRRVFRQPFPSRETAFELLRQARIGI